MLIFVEKFFSRKNFNKMKKETNELLEQLLSKIEGKEEFNELRETLFKRGVEALLNAELTAHLGHKKGEKSASSNIRKGYSEKTIKTSDGAPKIKVPRDRDASFNPVIVPKHKSMSQELEDCVLLLYAKGMSNAAIIDFIETLWASIFYLSSFHYYYSTSKRYQGMATATTSGSICSHLDRCYSL